MLKLTLIYLIFLQIFHYVYCQKSVFHFSINDSNGNVLDLSQFKGKVLLFTNVASECGYTDSHYKMLTKLNSKYSFKGLQILAFPCNDFGKQEPQSSHRVARWAKNKYNVDFPILQKISFYNTGEELPDVWQYLIEQSETPKWNFWKYVIGRNGQLIDFLDHFQMENIIEPIIIKALNVKEDL